MVKKVQACRRIARTWAGGPRKVKNTVKPFTKINVKPYVIIRCKGMILCGGDEEIPLVFDNNDLARGFAIANDVDDGCEFKTMMLEELVLMCRSTKIHFDSFYLIDHRSQLA